MTGRSKSYAVFGFLVGFLVVDALLSFITALSGETYSPLLLNKRYICLFYIAFDIAIAVYLVTGWRGAVLLGALYMFIRASLIILALVFFSPLLWLASGVGGRLVSLASIVLFVLSGFLLILWYRPVGDAHKQFGQEKKGARQSG